MGAGSKAAEIYRKGKEVHQKIKSSPVGKWAVTRAKNASTTAKKGANSISENFWGVRLNKKHFKKDVIRSSVNVAAQETMVRSKAKTVENHLKNTGRAVGSGVVQRNAGAAGSVAYGIGAAKIDPRRGPLAGMRRVKDVPISVGRNAIKRGANVDRGARSKMRNIRLAQRAENRKRFTKHIWTDSVD